MRSCTRYRFGVGLVCIGIGLSFTVAATFAWFHADSNHEKFTVFIPSILAILTALWLATAIQRRKIPKSGYGRAAVWYLAGGLLFAVASYESFSENVGTVLPIGTWFSVGNWAIAGSALGLILANYDLRRTQALREARLSERRATLTTQRLSVLSRVLRHDIRNKLSIILGRVQLLDQHGADPEDVESIEAAAESLLVIAERAQRLRSIVEDESPRPVNLTEMLTNRIDAFREEFPEARVTMNEVEPAVVSTYPDIQRSLEDLLENAIEHNPAPEADCEVEVSLRRVQSAEGETAEIRITDNGPGIPERERVVTTDDAETQLEHSRGMSLWTARWIADESGGDFKIDTTCPGGTRILLHLPIVGG